MTVQDLPAHWQQVGFSVEEIPNADLWIIQYQAAGTSSPSPYLVSHRLANYTTENAATSAYSEWERKYFSSSAWQEPSVEDFTPKDQHRLACLSVSINSQPLLSCTYLQMHKNAISLVLVNIDDDHIAFEQFISALKLIDIRLQQNLQ